MLFTGYWLVRLSMVVHVGGYQQAGTLFRFQDRYNNVHPTLSFLNTIPLGEYLGTVFTISLYFPSGQVVVTPLSVTSL